MLIKGEITQEDINLGCIGDKENCPLARSFNRIFKSETPIRVNKWSFKVAGVEESLPIELRVFITKFDLKQKVQPMKYEFNTKHLHELKDGTNS